MLLQVRAQLNIELRNAPTVVPFAKRRKESNWEILASRYRGKKKKKKKTEKTFPRAKIKVERVREK